MPRVTAACNAMATRFEVVLHGENPVSLRAAAEEAFHEIERLHSQLSLYSPSSEISSINAHAFRQAVPVEPGLFRLLQLAQRIHRETDGAFDVTVAPLIRCWGFMGGTGTLPTEEQIAEARTRVGMQHVLLDDSRSTIRFAREGMMLDLGSIGKGYGLEMATEIFLDAGVTSALIHGGTSTISAIGSPPGQSAWKVAIDLPVPPDNTDASAIEPGAGEGDSKESRVGEDKRPLAVVELKDEALSVSGVHGKFFRLEGKTYGHVLDPRTGRPAQGALLAAVAMPSATESDALSTALLLAGCAGHQHLANLRPGLRLLVVEEFEPGSGRLRVESRGMGENSCPPNSSSPM